jgi:hypothetical protein
MTESCSNVKFWFIDTDLRQGCGAAGSSDADVSFVPQGAYALLL